MIKLEFEINEEELADSTEESLIKADSGALYTTYFIMPIRFRINNKDVFLMNKLGPWFDIALLDLAASCLYDIRILPKKKNLIHRLPETWGDLKFKYLENDKVTITLNENNEKFVVNYVELLEAFENFSSEVKKFLCKSAPELKKHAFWGRWLTGKVNVEELW